MRSHVAVRILVALAVFLALVACRSGFESRDPAALDDGGLVADARSLDASADPTPWVEPTPVASVNGPQNTDDPSLTADLLELYFNDNRAGGSGLADIWVATRASADDAWDPPMPVSDLNTAGNDNTPEVSADGLTLFLTRHVGGVPDIFVSTRPNRMSAWSPPAPVSELNTISAEVAAMADIDGTTLFFCSDREGLGHHDMYMTTRASSGDMWSPPALLTEVNSPGHDCDPFLTDDGLSLYMGRDIDMDDDYDIYVATRTTPSEPFSTPIRIDELATEEGETDAWVSPDGSYMIFTREVDGQFQLYETSR